MFKLYFTVISKKPELPKHRDKINRLNPDRLRPCHYIKTQIETCTRGVQWIHSGAFCEAVLKQLSDFPSQET